MARPCLSCGRTASPYCGRRRRRSPTAMLFMSEADICLRRTLILSPPFAQTRAEAAHSSGLNPELLTMGFQKRNSCFCNAASCEDVLGAETMPRPSSFVITWGVINAF